MADRDRWQESQGNPCCQHFDVNNTDIYMSHLVLTITLLTVRQNFVLKY